MLSRLQLIYHCSARSHGEAACASTSTATVEGGGMAAAARVDGLKRRLRHWRWQMHWRFQRYNRPVCWLLRHDWQFCESVPRGEWSSCRRCGCDKDGYDW